MLQKSIMVENETGIHARPAGLIVKEASKFKSEVVFLKDSARYNAKSIMSIMAMAADKGETITITANGADEAAAMDAMVILIRKGLE